MKKETQFEKNCNQSIDEMKKSIIDYNLWNDENKLPNLDAKIQTCKWLMDHSQKINQLAQKQMIIEVEKYRKLKN